MKYIHTIAAGLLLCAGLASCEMKEELQGGSETSDKGFLNLNVSVNAKENTVVTKANDDISDDGENPGSPVSADDFPVELVCTTNPDYSRTFESYAALQEEIPVELSVGEYTITAHSNEDLQAQMPVPYYEGDADIKITKDVEATATVVCTMKNTKIVIRYGAVFLANFTSWDISIDDGSSNILKFDETDTTNPAPIYWLIEEGQNEIKVNITATKSDGTSITDSRTLTKPEGGNSAYWTGGDALTITMEGLEPTPGNPTGVTGIEITANVTFQELEDDTVEVPVTGGDPTPPGPGTGELTINMPKESYTLPDDIEADGKVLISTGAGLKSVEVQITPGNQTFSQLLVGAAATYQLNFLTGAELIDNTNLETIVEDIAPGLEAPATGDTEYEFPVDAFFNTLQGASPTTSADGHVFKITVEDAAGNTVEKSLSVIVKGE